MDEQGKRAFAKRLRERIAELNVSQPGLQKAVLGPKSKGNSVVQNWLKGHIPRADRLDQLADALSVTRDWLLYGTEPKLAADVAKVSESQVREALRPLEPAQLKFVLVLAKKMAA